MITTDEEGEIDLNLFVEIAENHLRERRVAAFSVTNKKTNTILVVTELDPVYTRRYPIHGDGEFNLEETLQRATKDFIARYREAGGEEVINRAPLPSISQIFRSI